MVKKYIVEVDEAGTQSWYNEENQLHRENGPAIEFVSGANSWWHNGKRHRVGGPALTGRDGTKLWYINDQLHREDGPAMECYDGSNHYLINGEFLTEEQFKRRMSSHLCDGKIVEIDGKKYELKAV